MRWIVFIAALLGLLSVILGAAGDHMLEGSLTAQGEEQFAVALRYHQLYSVILLFLGLYGARGEQKGLLLSASIAFLAGTIIFSGTLYLSVIFSVPWLVYGTPVGGILLMAGWVLTAAWSVFPNRKPVRD